MKAQSFLCGFCSHRVSSDKGYKLGTQSSGEGGQLGGIYICPQCQGPTCFTTSGEQLPAPSIGKAVDHVPQDLAALYEEARRSTSANCYTGAVLLCRKMLMNVAVAQGAGPGLKFIEYVDYLATQGYIPPNGRHWVDHIRKKGNEATHEIALMGQKDAQELLTLTEMLLRFIYEFPQMVPLPKP